MSSRWPETGGTADVEGGNVVVALFRGYRRHAVLHMNPAEADLLVRDIQRAVETLKVKGND